MSTHIISYTDLAPSIKNAFTLFGGEWSTAISGMNGPGPISYFDDFRINWLSEKLGEIKNWSVLELGPLEGHHTFMLEKLGANVLAIEGNPNAFLRCLIVKNHFDLKAKFLLGDFSKVFENDVPKNFDLIIASGIFYHQTDPVNFLKYLTEKTNRLFLWTHYYEENLDLWNPEARKKIGAKWQPEKALETNLDGEKFKLIPQSYGNELASAAFAGGQKNSPTG